MYAFKFNNVKSDHILISLIDLDLEYNILNIHTIIVD